MRATPIQPAAPPSFDFNSYLRINIVDAKVPPQNTTHLGTLYATSISPQHTTNPSTYPCFAHRQPQLTDRQPIEPGSYCTGQLTNQGKSA